MFGAPRNPDLIAGFRFNGCRIYFDQRPIVQDNPQFGAGGMRLQAEPLPRRDRHQTCCHVFVIGVLQKAGPGADDLQRFRTSGRE